MALSGKSGISGGVEIRGSDVGERVYTAATTAAVLDQAGFSTATKNLVGAATTAAAQTLLNQGTVQYSKLTVSAAVASGSVSLPANSYIERILIMERAGNAITGGLQIGVADAGGTIVSAAAVGANANVVVSDAALLTKFFSVAAAQSIHYDAVTSWNSANVNIVIVYGKL